jgi:SAM-dependent methyltransferase
VTTVKGDGPKREILKGVLILLCIGLAVAAVITAQQGIQALNELTVVERERDQWQRPSEIIQLLDLHAGDVVAEGSGVGYFSVKLSPVVGKNGKVLAIDVRKLPLIFLWIRALLHHQSNIDVIVGDLDDPHLPAASVDAVLIANTYHELQDPQRILGHVVQSLRPGGRLVVVDRGLRSDHEETPGVEAEHHDINPSLVEGDIRQSGLEEVQREDHFIDLPNDHPWWFIAARKP